MSLILSNDGSFASKGTIGKDIWKICKRHDFSLRSKLRDQYKITSLSVKLTSINFKLLKFGDNFPNVF